MILQPLAVSYRTMGGGLILLPGFVFTHTRHEHGAQNTARLTGMASGGMG
jgi:hypothetical protein